MTDFDYATLDRLLPPTPGAADWGDVLNRVDEQGRRRWIVMLAAATVLFAAAAASVGSVLTLPWGGSPGFLERAEAALTPPEGTILHYKLEASRISAKFGCSVTGPYEMWVDTASQHGWRAVKAPGVPPGNLARHKTADPRTLACSDWGTYEVGAPSNLLGTLQFVPPSTLRVAPVQERFQPVDHVEVIRNEIGDALASGRAHNEGMTEIDGRAVVRYRLDCRDDPCPRPSYVYMDPETFLPVKTESPYAFTLVLENSKCSTSGPLRPGPGCRFLSFDIVERYLAIEYLPRTPENLALTDIRAQHPNATGP